MKRTWTVLMLCVVTAWTVFAGPADLNKLSTEADRYKGTHDHVMLMEDTEVKVFPTGMTNVEETRAIKVLSDRGCRDFHTVSFFYDPLTQDQRVTDARIMHADGSERTVDLETVKQFPQPARAIYWPNIRVSIPFGLLEPGDVVQYTVKRKGFSYALLDDPVNSGSDDSRFTPPMKGHFYDIVHFQGFTPTLYKRYAVELPQEKPIQYRYFHGEVTPVAEFTDYGMRYTFTKKNIEPLKREAHMVDASDVCEKLLISTTVSWTDKSEWFYGVNEHFAFNYTPEIQDKVNELVANCKTVDEKVDVLNHWVAHYIRYSGLTMGEGEGFTLHPADMNYTDRQGVCKDKASLLITFLRAAGLDAYPAMTMAGARIENFPADHFNHCVVALRHEDGTFEMLDPTWVPWVREQWSSAEQEQQYLIGYKDGQELMTTPYSAPENHYYRIRTTGKVDRDGTFTGTIRIEGEGQVDARMRRYGQRDHEIQSKGYFAGMIRVPYPAAEIRNLDFQSPWDISRPMVVTATVTIPAFAIMDGDMARFQSPSLILPRADRGINPELGWQFGSEERDYGFRTRCTKLVDIRETIQFPGKIKLDNSTLPEKAQINGQYADMTLSASVDGKTVETSLKLVLKKRVYPADAWKNFQDVVSGYQKIADTWYRIAY